MKSKAEQTLTSKLFKFFKIIVGFIVLLWVPVDCVYTIYKNNHRNSALEGKTVQKRAVVINKKNYYGNSPVTQQFSYSYRFELNGKVYEGDSQNPSLRIGDSISIEYAQTNPEINQPVDN